MYTCSSKKEDKGRNQKSPKPPLQQRQASDSFLLSKPPASSQDSDIHITVLCLKALMNNAVSCCHLNIIVCMIYYNYIHMYGVYYAGRLYF